MFQAWVRSMATAVLKTSREKAYKMKLAATASLEGNSREVAEAHVAASIASVVWGRGASASRFSCQPNHSAGGGGAALSLSMQATARVG
jgi:hypothetical protein